MLFEEQFDILANSDFVDIEAFVIIYLAAMFVCLLFEIPFALYDFGFRARREHDCKVFHFFDRPDHKCHYSGCPCCSCCPYYEKPVSFFNRVLSLLQRKKNKRP